MKTNATRQLDKLGITYELCEYKVDLDDLHVFRPIRPLPVGALTIAQKRVEAAIVLGHDEALEQAKVVVDG